MLLGTLHQSQADLGKDNNYREFMVAKNVTQKVQLSEKTGLHFGVAWYGLGYK